MDPFTAAAVLAPTVIGAFRRKKRPNRNAIINRYRNSRPVGYTTAEDEAFAERQRVKGNAAAKSVAQQRRAINAGQVRARGLGGAAAAALEQNATDVEAMGAEESARTSADLLYKAFASNRDYARHQNDTAFGQEMQVATEDAARADAQNASFWNSVNESITAIAPMLSTIGGGGTAVAQTPAQNPTSQIPGTTFNPSHRSPPAPQSSYLSTEYR